MFMLPSGKPKTLFIKEIIKLLLWWVDVTAMCEIAFPGIMIMPSLLLQKPKHFRKTYRTMEQKSFYGFIKESETMQIFVLFMTRSQWLEFQRNFLNKCKKEMLLEQ